MPSIVEPIPLDLDRRRHVRLDNRAMFLAERTLCRVWDRKVNLLSVLADPQGLTLNDLAALLWAGLQHEDPTLTLEQVQDLMDLDKVGAITQAVFAAWNTATAPVPGSQRPPDEADGPFAPAPSTGAPSGAMGAAALA